MGGSRRATLDERRRRGWMLGASLGIEAGLAAVMMLALALGPRPLREPPAPPLTVSRLYLPPRIAPAEPRRPPRPIVIAPAVLIPPRPWRARFTLLRRAPAPAPPPLPSPPRREAGLAPPPVMAVLVSPAPPLPPPAAGVEAPVRKVVTGRFGAPAGLAPQPGKPVPAPEMGQFAASPAAAPARSAAGEVRSAGFGTGPAGMGTTVGGLSQVQAGGFAAANPGGGASSGGPSPSVALGQFSPARAPAGFSPAPDAAPAGPEFEAPEVLSWPQPIYTAAAAEHRIEGEVVLELRLGAHGQVEVVAVRQSLGYGLDQSAAAAARQLQYRPARRHGQAVDWTVWWHVQFRLAN